jgi:hypothetical protein
MNITLNSNLEVKEISSEIRSVKIITANGFVNPSALQNPSFTFTNGTVRDG